MARKATSPSSPLAGAAAPKRIAKLTPQRLVRELELRRREAEAARAAAEAALARLAQSEERFRMLAERTSDVVIRYDPSGVIEYASPAANTWGYPPHELVGRNVTEFCHPEDLARLQAERDGLTRGRSLDDARAPFRLQTADGSWRWAEGSPSALLDHDGVVVGIVTALRDVTARLAMEDELRRSRNDAEQANRAKSSFLATMSHEIRTPLNGVLGMAQAMSAGALTSTQRKRLDVIQTSGEQLLAILNDVLDVSKIEAGKLALEHVEFDLGKLCAGAISTFAAVANSKSLRLELAITESARGRYVGDPTRLRQILTNLVSNAVKFTDQGGVEVEVDLTAAGLRIDVRDTGIGLAPDQLARIFDRFEQADVSTTRRFGGAGLGLGICRDLAQLMGGCVTAAAAPGAGAVFTVELPLQRIAGEADEWGASGPIEAPDASLRLLIADDNETNRIVLKTILEQVGLSPKLVNDGAAAVEAWEAEVFDAILMDVQMPRMDGLAATQLIRQRERHSSRARTPIIALTADAMAHQVSECERAGMDGHIAKPIEIDRLFTALSAALGEGAAAARASA